MDKEALIVQAASSGELAGVIKWLFGLVSGAFSILLGIVWTKHQDEIKALKTSVATMTPLEHFNVIESRMRDNVIELHRKIEDHVRELGDKITEADRIATSRHIELLNAMRREK